MNRYWESTFDFMYSNEEEEFHYKEIMEPRAVKCEQCSHQKRVERVLVSLMEGALKTVRMNRERRKDT